MHRKLFIVIIVLVVLGAGFLWYKNSKPLHIVPEGPVACTMDAKMCPDGSYVGRVGPDCQFAACPTPTGTRLGATVKEGGLDITPLALQSDSRCPEDVQCIWAGEVTLKIKVSENGKSEEKTITSTKSVTFNGKTIELTNVYPPANSKKPSAPGDYRFEFTVK